MIRVKQTILGAKGNCFAACVASILELPIEDVPNLGNDSDNFNWSDWMRLWNEWLESRNLCLSVIHYYEWEGVSSTKPKGYSILSAKSPRLKEQELNHAVVCFDGKIVFDPHPQREMGVGVWEYFYVFSALNPALFTVKGQSLESAIADVHFSSAGL